MAVNKFVVRYLCKTMRKKVEALFPCWKWLVQYLTSDAMGVSAHKVWPALRAWVQCTYHIFHNL